MLGDQIGEEAGKVTGRRVLPADEGAGVGQFVTERAGFVHYSGALHYTSSSEAFAPLNGISGVFEFDVDRDDNTRGKIGEWK